MTDISLIDPQKAPESAGRRGAATYADFLRLVHGGGLSEEQAAAVLGFVRLPDTPAARMNEVADREADVGERLSGDAPFDGTGESSDLPPISTTALLRYFVVSDMVTKLPSTEAINARAWPLWLEQAGRLQKDPSDDSIPVPKAVEIAPRRRLLPALRFAASRAQQTTHIDLLRLVKRLAEHGFVHRFPCLKAPRYASQLVVLRDVSAAVLPYRGDGLRIANLLAEQRGEHGLLRFKVDGAPSEPDAIEAELVRRGKVRPTSRARGWSVPPAGTPLLIVSDLGLTCQDQRRIQSWLLFGRQLLAAGIRATVLSPMPVSPRFRALHQVFTIQVLDRNARLRPGVADPSLDRDGEADTQAIKHLLAMSAAASWVSPALLRTFRQWLSPEADHACLEAMLAAHPDVLFAPHGYRLASDAARERAAQGFVSLPVKVQRDALQAVLHHHQHLPESSLLQAVERCATLLPDCLQTWPGLHQRMLDWRASSVRTALEAPPESLFALWLRQAESLTRQPEREAGEVSRARALVNASLLAEIDGQAQLPFQATDEELRLFFPKRGRDDGPSPLTRQKVYLQAGVLWLDAVRDSGSQEEPVANDGQINQGLRIDLAEILTDGAPLRITVRSDPPEGLDGPSVPAFLSNGQPILPGPVRGLLTDRLAAGHLAYGQERSPEYLGLPTQQFVALTQADEPVPLARCDQHVVAIELENHFASIRISALTKPRGAAAIRQDRDGLRVWTHPWLGKPRVLRWGLVGVAFEGQVSERAVDSILEGAFWQPDGDSFPGDIGIDHHGVWAAYDLAAIDRRFARMGVNLRQRHRYIEPGTFLMGSPEDEPQRYSDESPQHPVVLTQGYWLAETACTQALWQAVMGKNPSHFDKDVQGKPTPLRPVENVSWNDIQDFNKTLNRLVPGLEAGLPTEAQWEYACRAGTTTPFSFGASVDSTQASFDGNNPYNQGETSEYRRHTIDVASLPSNSWGLYEMHGNVWEWCWDGRRDYEKSRAVDPIGSTDPGADRALRGGCWRLSGGNLRSALRLGYEPGSRNFSIGFRLAPGQSPAASEAAAASGGAGRASERSRASQAEAQDDAAADREAGGVFESIAKLFNKKSSKTTKKPSR